MEKIEVEQGFLSKLMEMAGQVFQFENSKDSEHEAKETKKEEKKEDDDEMEYEGKKYSKKELVNCYTAKEKKNAEDMKDAIDKEDEKQNSKEEEQEEEDSVEFFNAMAKKVAEGSQNKDKIEVHTQAKGLELGKSIFG